MESHVRRVDTTCWLSGSWLSRRPTIARTCSDSLPLTSRDHCDASDLSTVSRRRVHSTPCLTVDHRLTTTTTTTVNCVSWCNCLQTAIDGAIKCWALALPFDTHVAIWYSYSKHRVPDRVKPPNVIFDIRALWRSVWVSKGHYLCCCWDSLISDQYLEINRLELRERTSGIDLNLADVQSGGVRTLHNDILTRWHTIRTPQVNCHTVADNTWPLSTYVIVPQTRRLHSCRHVLQADDEVV